MSAKKPGVLGIIPARGGSKGIKDKNIVQLAGKPLIEYTFKAAKKSERLTRVILSTDSGKIAELGKNNGIETPFLRPPEFSGDKSPASDYIDHCLEFLESSEGYLPTIVVILQPTAPLREYSDIDKALDVLMGSDADSVVSVSRIPDYFHPAWQFVVEEGGVLKRYGALDIKSLPGRRQDLPATYTRNGAIYAFYLRAYKGTRSIYGKKTLAYIMPGERSVNIDSPDDMELAEAILRKG